ncbi:MAG: hypothetical protein Q9203_003930 [Teloschistes exilis]
MPRPFSLATLPSITHKTHIIPPFSNIQSRKPADFYQHEHSNNWCDYPNATTAAARNEYDFANATRMTRSQLVKNLILYEVKPDGLTSYFRKQAFTAPIMQRLLPPLQDANSPPSNKAVAILKAL